MKNQSLLRRFRWPLFILLWGAGQYTGTMFLYGQTKEAGIGFVIALGVMCIAVVLNSIDESQKNIPNKWDVLSAKFTEALNNITPEELEKYFPADTRPEGWISIEDDLPKMMAGDIGQGYTKYRVLYGDGTQGISGVSDHATWYYRAKADGITHWWHEATRNIRTIDETEEKIQ